MSSISAAARLSRRGAWVLLTFALLALGWSHEARAQCSQSAPCADAPVDIGTFGGSYSYTRGISSDGSVVAGYAADALGYFRAFRWEGGSKIDLGTLGGWSAQGRALSWDGSTVVGYSTLDDGITNHAFRWTAATGMVDLGTLGGASSDASAVSDNGSVVAGTADTSSGSYHAFRWTAATDMVDLGTLGGSTSAATDISGDGSVVVGYSATDSGSVHAFRWDGAIEDVGSFGGNSTASAVSADGKVVIGQSYTAGNAQYHAFRWENGSLEDIGTFGGTRSFAVAVNATGTIVVGYAHIAGNAAYHAYRYENGSKEDLGTLGGSDSLAYGLTDDGSVIVGGSQVSSGVQHAFRWTAATGIQDLNTLLSDAGVDMTGITLSFGRNLSANGQFITGQGDFSGENHAFVVRYYDGTPAEAPIVGVTNVESVQQSVNDMAESRAGAMAQQNGLAMPLLGDDKPISDESNVGVFAQAGSGQVGATTQFGGSNGLTLLGGISYGYEDYDNAKIDDAVMGALAARYVMPTGSAWRPFVEGGGWYAPDADLEFSRTYMNGAGTATGVGNTHGTVSYLFGRAGVLWSLGKGEQLALSAEYGHEKLDVDGYSETLSNANPFNALVSSGTDEMDLVKARAQWSFVLAKGFDATLWAAGVYGFNRETDFMAAVAGVGTIAPIVDDTTAWAEYGARVGYALTDVATLDVFVNGVSGPANEVDTRIHGGVGLRYRY